MYINMALLAAKTTIGATNLAVTAGKKLIEVSIPAAKKASLISFKFIQGGIEAITDKPFHSEKMQLSDN